MTIASLLTYLAERGLTLCRVNAERLAVLGDPASVTEELRQALIEHKAALLALLPIAKPPTLRPAWWSDTLSDAQNEELDAFLGKDQPQGPEATMIGVEPCPKCGSLLAWWDSWGTKNCFKCNPPLRAITLLGKLEALRQKAAERQLDPKAPKVGPEPRRRPRRLPTQGKNQAPTFRAPCDEDKHTLQEVRVAQRRPDAEPDPQGEWIRTSCSTCGAFKGYRPADAEAYAAKQKGKRKRPPTEAQLPEGDIFTQWPARPTRGASALPACQPIAQVEQPQGEAQATPDAGRQQRLAQAEATIERKLGEASGERCDTPALTEPADSGDLPFGEPAQEVGNAAALTSA